MDIQQTIAPAATKLPTADKSDKSADAGQQQLSASSFSDLLQGAQGGEELPVAGLLIDTSEIAASVVDTNALPVDQVTLVPSVELLHGAWSVDSLVGQTQRLDIANVDLDLQNGSYLLSKHNADLQQSDVNLDDVLLSMQEPVGSAMAWGAQPNVALGHSVATVAAGVQAAVPAPNTMEARVGVAAAASLVTEVADVVEAVAQSVSDGLQSDAASEGRVALHGAWKLEDAQAAAHPVLHRVMGQVEQWAAASAGIQSKSTERTEAKSAANTAEWLSAGQGSGTRLTENAVQEVQQAQDVAFETPDAPVEDMRFWLQGKQQRAEVVLDKDGQPVRVQVSVRGNEAHVTFRSDQTQTREMLDASVAQLRDMLEQQGVELAGVSVQADGREGEKPSQQGQSSPWKDAPVQHAQVTLPVGDVSTAARQSAQGLDLYA